MDSYQTLFRDNGDLKPKELLRWRYSQPPTADSLVLLAEDCSLAEPDSAALYAVHGVPLRVDGRRLTAAQSLDTLTDRNHRKQGLFLWLAEACYQAFAERGGALVFGFPNPSSYPAFSARLGWSMLNPTPFIIRPMRSGYFLDALLRKLGLARGMPRWLDQPLGRFARSATAGLELREMASFDNEHDRLWARFSKDIRVCVDRTASYMNWRVFAHPEGKYRVLGVYRSGRLVAEVVWCLELKHGGRIGYILELLVDPEDRGAGQAALAAALSELAAERADAALAWNANHPPNAPVYRRAGFLPLPERLRPSNIYWGVRCLDDAIAPVVRDRANWYISYTDSDTT
jgi:GNAT superfamily N-acetyltransferase